MDRYRKDYLEQIIIGSKSKSEIIRKIGLRTNSGNFDTLNFYIEKYNLNISHLKPHNSNKFNKKRELSDILIEHSTYTNRTKLKMKLYKSGLKTPICELCEQDENWKGKKMSLILDHKNGVPNDNRLENLQIVCANCNATLETHCRGHKVFEKDKKDKNNFTEKQIDYYIKIRKVKRPEYEKLINELKLSNFVKVGKKYGVSDNAVRKWIKYYEKTNGVVV